MFRSSDIPESEKTSWVVKLLEVIRSLKQENQTLKKEITRLKGHPKKPELRPSKIGKSEKKSKKNIKKPQTKKSKDIEIHNTVEVHPQDISKGSKLLRYQDYIVQDMKLIPYNTKYRLAVYRMPDGSIRTAKPPVSFKPHFGSELQAHILYLYFRANMTQPAILEYLTEHGIQISSNQIHRILVENHDDFHAEKQAILKRGLKVSKYVVADDTGHRHKGQNGYTTHLGNEFFTFFESSASKSRLNFLEILCVDGEFYHLNGFAYDYLDAQGFPKSDLNRLRKSNCLKFSKKVALLQFLKNHSITSEHHIKIVTEAALIGYLSTAGLLNHLVFVSDEAGQFNVFIHGLCWIHTERKLTKLVPHSEEQVYLIKQTLDHFWKFHADLRQYKKDPTYDERIRLKKVYHKIFEPSTSWKDWNTVLTSFVKNADQLLRVLDRPEIPLSNNESERDIRCVVTKRKVSAGTRSDDGRKSRDTFLSLSKTCKKLEVSFFKYLEDRLSKENQIRYLPDIISEKALQFN